MAGCVQRLLEDNRTGIQLGRHPVDRDTRPVAGQQRVEQGLPAAMLGQ